MDRLDFFSKNITKTELIFEYKIGNTTRIFKEQLKTLEANGYENLPFLRNPPRLEAADDLTTLSYLHEAGKTI